MQLETNDDISLFMDNNISEKINQKKMLFYVYNFPYFVTFKIL